MHGDKLVIIDDRFLLFFGVIGGITFVFCKLDIYNFPQPVRYVVSEIILLLFTIIKRIPFPVL